MLLFSINTLLLFPSGIFPAGLHCNNTTIPRQILICEAGFSSEPHSRLFTVSILTRCIN